MSKTAPNRAVLTVVYPAFGSQAFPLKSQLPDRGDARGGGANYCKYDRQTNQPNNIKKAGLKSRPAQAAPISGDGENKPKQSRKGQTKRGA